MIDVPVLFKDALREGDKRKNYRIVVYQADGETVDFTIDNDNLVSESVAFDERMCSDTNLKFGLCEGTSVEFQYFGYGNITGRRIQVFLDVQYTDTDGTDKWHSIPMGWFTVDETSRQASTGIRKASAYNKLKSEYLNESANPEIMELVSGGENGHDDMSFFKILEGLLEGYSIETYNRVDFEMFGWNSTSSQSFTAITSDGSITKNVYIAVGNHMMVFDDPTDPDYVSYGVTEYNGELKSYVDDFISWIRQNNIQLRGGPDNRYHSIDDYIANPTWDVNGTTTFKFYSLLGPMSCGDETYLPDGSILSGSEPRIYDMNGDYASKPHRIGWVNHGYQIPYAWSFSGPVGSKAEFDAWEANFETEYGNTYQIWKLDVPELAYKSITYSQAQSFPEVTLRDLQTSVYETVCQYGKLDRVTDLFSGVELNNSRLYPADNLYPANDLYPNSTSERSNPAMYEKLWADEGNIRSFRHLIITYKGVEQDDQGNLQEVEKKLQRTVDEHGTDDYNMSDNWIFKNLVWSDSDIGDYADAMVLKMRNVTWFPFEMWCAGLPYIETGDEVEINMSNGAYTSYVLRRNLKGIQDLHDEMINGTLDIF